MLRELMHELSILAAEGGFSFWALLALSFGIAYSIISISYALLLPHAPIFPQRQWQYMLSRRDIPPGMIQKLSNALDTKNPSEHIHEIEHQLFNNLDRHFPFAFILIGTAPLIGLLGTVSGMLTTFSGMSSNDTVAANAVSIGISEALVTTQTGLVIGVSSLFVCSVMRLRYEQLCISFLHIESAIKQIKKGL